MLPVGELYDDCAKLNIPVLPCSLPENGSISLMDERGACYIGMDGSVLDLHKARGMMKDRMEAEGYEISER